MLDIILVVLGISNIVLCLIVLNNGAASVMLNTLFSTGIVGFNITLIINSFVSEYGKNLRLVGTSDEKEALAYIIIFCIAAGITALTAVWTRYNKLLHTSLIAGCFTACLTALTLIPMFTLRSTSLDELKAQAKKNEDSSATSSVEYTEDNLYVKPVTTAEEIVPVTILEITKEVGKEDLYIVSFDLEHSLYKERTYTESEFNTYIGKDKTHITVEYKTAEFIWYDLSSGYGYTYTFIVYDLLNDEDFRLDSYARDALILFNSDLVTKEPITWEDPPNSVEDLEAYGYTLCTSIRPGFKQD